MTTDSNKKLKAALWYATQKGWPVVALHTPNDRGSCSCASGAMCHNSGKHPRFHKILLAHGAKSATTDPEIVRKWWMMWPDANVGIATGKDSFDVLDVDKDGEGSDTLYEKCRECGKLPDSIEQITGGGGRQIMFEYVGGLKNEVRFASGLDIRTDGGLVVVPPSMHSSGRCYVWEESSRPEATALARMPEWMLNWILENTKSTAADNGGGVDPMRIFDGIEKGERDNELFRYACRLRTQGLQRPEAEAIILAAANRCKPAFSKQEALKKVAQAWKYAGPEIFLDEEPEPVTTVTSETTVTSDIPVTNCNKPVTNCNKNTELPLSDKVLAWLW